MKSGIATLESLNGDSFEAKEGFSYIISEAVDDKEQSVEESEMSDADIPKDLFD
jgi:hypothetical protein